METLCNIWRGGNREATIEAIVTEAKKFGFVITQIAYILATVQHETGGTFQPIKEGFSVSETWREKNLRYFPYYGRGYAQLTWLNNYQKYSHLLNINLIEHPNLALRPDISLFVLLHGMKYGVFTGKSLNNYTRGDKTDFYNARRIINGLDRAQLIAGYAQQWTNQLM